MIDDRIDSSIAADDDLSEQNELLPPQLPERLLNDVDALKDSKEGAAGYSGQKNPYRS